MVIRVNMYYGQDMRVSSGIEGINGENAERSFKLNLSFLNKQYKKLISSATMLRRKTF